MKRMICCLLALFCLTGIAFASETGWVPVAIETADGIIRETYAPLETGEIITVIRDEKNGKITGISGINETCVPESIPGRPAAETMMESAFPGACMISMGDCLLNGAPALRVNLIAGDFCGYAVIGDDSILAREIAFGAYMDDTGLTREGAKAAVLLHRPGFRIDEIEKDNDDGLVLYEGEGYLDGVEYEFELDARTGRLLQWERD